ncbi:hypothetical protein LACFE_CDS1445 [Limosilactobacillus fermentum]|uniref:Uncharacterized protein n=1 Tax=Limosilactobacillus fermentum TaxID=1613 RepID=A0A1D7ZYF4_LIMFE|nr:hypothetical protein LACFE_CDS1445 [Limosilactobacillus fermentum]
MKTTIKSIDGNPYETSTIKRAGGWCKTGIKTFKQIIPERGTEASKDHRFMTVTK